MNVPFVDLKVQYKQYKKEIDEAIGAVISEAAFVGGKYVQKFEEEFASATGLKHCISCANGTDSLYILIKMLGIGPGDEVITAANSWISSSETISQSGAKPVFVDVDPTYLSLDEKLLEKKITPRTKAIIAVHLQGQMCEMETIMLIAEKYKIPVIEDCAQSHFSLYKGRIAGTIGLAGSFSFYPGKNLGAYGDAGCIITNDDRLADNCRKFARHGALEKHKHLMEGINSRLDGMQAAILSVKLPHIHEWNKARKQHAERYAELLAAIPEIVLPVIRQETSHTFHLYIIKAENRDQLKNYLLACGIETSIHYPTALPFLQAYDYLDHQHSDFPVAHSMQNYILSLPMYPELSASKIEYVCDAINKFYRKISNPPS